MPTKITDAMGNITTMTYDSKGNLTQLTTPDGKITTFTYNSMGKPVSVTDPQKQRNSRNRETEKQGQVFTLAILFLDMHNIFHGEAVKDRI
jgi:YD repeat-containing protein